MARIEIEPIKPHIGGIVHVERAALCDAEVARQCLDALEDRGVLVFPRLALSDEEQLAFTDQLGHRVNFTRSAPGANAAAPDVYKITLDAEINDRPEYVLGTYFWHIDGVTVDIPVPKATLLTARKLSDEGGQTEFANTYAAYEHLPAWEKEAIEGLRALHTVAASFQPLIGEPSESDLHFWKTAERFERPIVWTHESGRKSLVIGTHADRVIGLPVPDGRAILTRLVEWAAQPDFRYTHQWQEGDLVVWDNCGVMHRVFPYDPNSGRTMHRTTIAGTESVH